MEGVRGKKIVHLCLCGAYNDGWGYQENLLTKYHKHMGLDVSVLASPFVNQHTGLGYAYHSTGTFYDVNGVKVTRLPLGIHQSCYLSKKLKIFRGLIQKLNEEEPDILFIHGVQFLSIRKVIAYLKKHPGILVFVDGHEDFNNTAFKFVSKYILHGLIWRYYARKIEPLVTTFWGVLPARVDFFSQMYGLPKEKTDLLVMGTDDEVVKQIDSNANKTAMSEKYNLAHDDFIIVTGGKLDSRKPQTLLLMEAVNKLENKHIKLIVFGSISDEHKHSFDNLLNDSIIYAGWLKSEDIFRLFDIADLAFFPGNHSVLWEQAVGQGVPCIFKYIQGFTHIDLGGNCKYLYKDSVSEIQDVLSSLIDNPNQLLEMKEIADKGKDQFYYSSIARKSCGQSN